MINGAQWQLALKADLWVHPLNSSKRPISVLPVLRFIAEKQPIIPAYVLLSAERKLQPKSSSLTWLAGPVDSENWNVVILTG